MNMKWKSHQSPCKRQQGMTLIELLIAGVISLIAVSAMVIVMGATLGTGSQTIQMARLTQEMRTGMQIMSRELRRANYHSTYLSCYGNMDCRTTLGIAGKVADINITDNGSSDCFWFWYDRPQTGAQVAVTGETVAAFRRDTDADGVGTIQMTTTRTAAPNCALDSANWVDITDAGIIDVLTFDIVDNVAGFTSYTEAINADGDSQNIERIRITMTASLVADASVPAWLQSNTNATRTLQDFIQVRNNTSSAAP